MGSIPTLDFIGANTPAAADQLAEETAIETAHGIVWPSAPQCVHGAIFDLDGTLLDSMPWWDDLGERYLRSLGKTPEPNIRYHFKRLTMEGSAHYMKETYGLEQSIEEICTGVMSGIEFAYRDCIQCKPSVVDMLEALSNAGVAMRSEERRVGKECA